MKSTLSIVLKNTVLLILLTIVLIFIFTKQIGFKEINYLFGFFGILYIITSCYEAFSIAKISKTAIIIPYFTYGFLAKRFIKVIAFICCGVVLMVSSSLIQYLAYLCFLIALTEVIVIIYRYIKGLSYIAFDNNLLIVSTNKLDVMNAQSIEKIEKRHGLTYFVSKQNQSITLRTDILKDKDVFNIQLMEWVTKNNISDKIIAS